MIAWSQYGSPRADFSQANCAIPQSHFSFEILIYRYYMLFILKINHWLVCFSKNRARANPEAHHTSRGETSVRFAARVLLRPGLSKNFRAVLSCFSFCTHDILVAVYHFYIVNTPFESFFAVVLYTSKFKCVRKGKWLNLSIIKLYFLTPSWQKGLGLPTCQRL